MHRSIAQKQAAYRKRLFLISPVSVLIIVVLFLSSDVVPYREIERTFGWKGATQLMPEITIIPDRDSHEITPHSKRQRAMASMDLEVLDETGPAEGQKRQEVQQEEKKKPILPDEDDVEFRAYPAHTEVPYSEDFIILHMVRPEYPIAELLEGIEGHVTVEILVNERGRVENAWVLTALGPRSFEEASLAAVKQFIFQPPREKGRPVPMWIRFLIRFRIYG